LGDLVAETTAGDRDELRAELRALEARLQVSEAARLRAELLADASSVLFESLDHKVVLERLARLVVRSFAEWCVIDLIEDGQLIRAAGAHADPAKQPLMDELQRRFPPHWDSPHPSVRALKTGQTQIFSDLSQEDIRQLTENDEHRRLITALGTRSGVTVPLSARGAMVGAFTAGSGQSQRRFG
jgi:hypothetical protein